MAAAHQEFAVEVEEAILRPVDRDADMRAGIAIAEQLALPADDEHRFALDAAAESEAATFAFGNLTLRAEAFHRGRRRWSRRPPIMVSHRPSCRSLSTLRRQPATLRGGFASPAS